MFFIMTWVCQMNVPQGTILRTVLSVDCTDYCTMVSTSHAGLPSFSSLTEAMES